MALWKIFGWQGQSKFTDAVWIVVLGIVVGAIFGYLFSGFAVILFS